MNLAQGLFMAEAEGHLDTHESKVQKMLRDIKNRYDAGQGELTVHDGYLGDFGLTFESLSGYDLQRMARVAETGRL
jgi:hypothetical protein